MHKLEYTQAQEIRELDFGITWYFQTNIEYSISRGFSQKITEKKIEVKIADFWVFTSFRAFKAYYLASAIKCHLQPIKILRDKLSTNAM